MAPPMSHTVARPGVPHRAGGKERRLGVVVVDALGVVRTGLGLVIGEHPRMRVAAEAGTALEAMEFLRRIRPRTDVVALVGLSLPGRRDSFWLIRTIRESFPTFMILTYGTQTTVGSVSRALLVGADGFVDLRVGPTDFLAAIMRVADGETVFAGVSADFLGSIAEGIEGQQEADWVLSRREREVLSVAAEGVPVREIASRLGVRERTVNSHLGHIYRKLGVGSRVAAIASASRSGLL